MSEIACDIPGVIIRALKPFADERGWLTELFRHDELPQGFEPVMGYVSMTKPGVARGPHEHVAQTDGFAFLFGKMRLYLWENREGIPPNTLKMDVGEANPIFVTVPPGVVHAYKNIGDTDALVLNFPDRLYAGWGRTQQVDEIRHESDPNSPYRLEDAQ